MNNELERTWKRSWPILKHSTLKIHFRSNSVFYVGTIPECFFRNLPEGIEENHEKSQLGQEIFGERFEPGTSQIQRCVRKR
jgi:hypothetical protein